MVEDEEEQSGSATGSKEDTALDRYQEQSFAYTSRSPRPKSQSLPGENPNKERKAPGYQTRPIRQRGSNRHRKRKAENDL